MTFIWPSMAMAKPLKITSTIVTMTACDLSTASVPIDVDKGQHDNDGGGKNFRPDLGILTQEKSVA